MLYYHNINHAAAWRLINGGYGCRVLDVRDAEEYEMGHLPGAIHVPLHEITRKIPYIMPNRRRPLLVYCGSGARSLPAVQVLAVMGYGNLYNLQRGIEYWPYRLVR